MIVEFAIGERFDMICFIGSFPSQLLINASPPKEHQISSAKHHLYASRPRKHRPNQNVCPYFDVFGSSKFRIFAANDLIPFHDADSCNFWCPFLHASTRSSGFLLLRNGRASLALWCSM